MPYDDLEPHTGNEHQNRLDFINPQIQVELEQLNCATDSINKLELELDDARAQFRSLLIESTQKIDALAKKLGSCVEKSRPYYEARIKAKEALQRTHDAAVLFERATSHHQAAKELVALAEEGLTTQGHTFDQSWQEMLNHSTEKVNRAEHDRTESARNHELCSREYQRMDGRVKQLQKELKREIARSRMGVRRSLLSVNTLVNALNLQMLPYFEMKAHFNQLMEMQKRQVSELEEEVRSSKVTYSQTLRRLEEISNQIHQARGVEAAAGLRGAGVGAESPDLDRGLGRLRVSVGSCMSGSSTLPSLLGEDPLGLEDEFYPPPYRLSSSRSHMQLGRRPSGDSGQGRLTVRDEDRSDTESLASVSTVSSVDPLSDQQIGYIALDDELQQVADGATCVFNHNFHLPPLDGSGHDSIDQAVARLSAVSLHGANGSPENRVGGEVPEGRQTGAPEAKVGKEAPEGRGTGAPEVKVGEEAPEGRGTGAPEVKVGEEVPESRGTGAPEVKVGEEVPEGRGTGAPEVKVAKEAPEGRGTGAPGAKVGEEAPEGRGTGAPEVKVGEVPEGTTTGEASECKIGGAAPGEPSEGKVRERVPEDRASGGVPEGRAAGAVPEGAPMTVDGSTGRAAEPDGGALSPAPVLSAAAAVADGHELLTPVAETPPAAPGMQ